MRQAEITVLVGERDACRRWLATVGSLEKLNPYVRARVELSLARVELALGERGGVPARVERALAAWRRTGDVLFESGVLLACCGQRDRGRELLRDAADQFGRDYRDRVGDFAWLGLARLRPAAPLTPPGRSGSFPLPWVGP